MVRGHSQQSSLVRKPPWHSSGRTKQDVSSILDLLTLEIIFTVTSKICDKRCQDLRDFLLDQGQIRQQVKIFWHGGERLRAAQGCQDIRRRRVTRALRCRP
jgi:hypothetical protein